MLRIKSRNLAAFLMLLVLAQNMVRHSTIPRLPIHLQGIYLLSTLVQMWSSFPPPLPSGDDGNAEKNLFSTIPAYEVFGSLFDWSFLIAAGLSAVVRWGASRVNGFGDED